MSAQKSSRRTRARTMIAVFYLLALTMGFVANLFILGPLGDQATQAAAATARDIPFTDVNPFGTSVFLDKEVENWKQEKTLQMIKGAGIGWIKQEFPWWELEFRKGYYFDDKYNKSSWEKYDRIVDLAEKYGLKLVARLDRTPTWARSSGSNPGAPPDNLNDFADFVQAFVEHYQGRINFIQIWNEPNLNDEWLQGTAVDPARYTEMLKLAYIRAKKADPNLVILSAPMAMTLENTASRRNLNELIYIDEMYQHGAKDYFDIMSANAFGLDQSPEANSDPNVLNFRRVELIRQLMVKYGDSGKPVWLTEYGWNSSPASMDANKLIWRRVSEDQQARWTVEGIRNGRQEWPWLGVSFIWYFRQVGDISPSSSEYYFGVVNPEFVPRPVYNALREAASERPVAGVGHYEETSAPVLTEGAWSLVADAQASGKTLLDSSAQGSKLSFTFHGTGVSLVAPKSPSGGIVFATIDGSSEKVTALPKDGQGRAYIDLYSPNSESQAMMPVVEGLGKEMPTATHTLELTVAPVRNQAASGNTAAVDAFVVNSERSYTLFVGVSGAIGLAMVATIGLVVLSRRRR